MAFVSFSEQTSACPFRGAKVRKNIQFPAIVPNNFVQKTKISVFLRFTPNNSLHIYSVFTSTSTYFIYFTSKVTVLQYISKHFSNYFHLLYFYFTSTLPLPYLYFTSTLPPYKCHLFDNKCRLSDYKCRLPDYMSMAMWMKRNYRLKEHSRRGNIWFSVWERFIPKVGALHSQHGNPRWPTGCIALTYWMHRIDLPAALWLTSFLLNGRGYVEDL